MDILTFSFIIPVKPGGHVAALDSLRCLDETSNTFEVLISEGCSPSIQRNRAAHEARGEVLYFLDDDSRVDYQCLTICASILKDSSVAVVGGPSLTPINNTRLQQLFGSALSSRFGAAANCNRYRSVGIPRRTTEKELILCNLAIRREIFLEFGGLNERLYPNEENELLDRIQAAGHTLIHAPQMAIHRSQRPTLRHFAWQMFSYGRGRGQQTLIAGPGSVMAFIPLIFLLYLLSFPLTARFQYYCLPLYAYLALDAIFSIKAVISTGSLCRVVLFFLFPVLHIANGYGLLYGLCSGKDGNTAHYDPKSIAIRRIKTFGQSVW